MSDQGTTIGRYLLFAGVRYYPRGGWADFRGSFDEEPLAVAHAAEVVEEDFADWWHIVDIQTQGIIREWDRDDEE